ncbi:inorganic diphosphatase [Escherichia coli]|nr:inorganic diphosphatase [Escherichia coli]
MPEAYSTSLRVKICRKTSTLLLRSRLTQIVSNTEIDKESGALFVDRFMSTAMFYPCNYGYINHTPVSGRWARLTYWSRLRTRLQPKGSVIRCRPVGVLKMTDEAGEDAKLIAVPHTKLGKEYDHIKDVNDLPELLKAQIRSLLRALQRPRKRQVGES